jgi:hypothetical protein
MSLLDIITGNFSVDPVIQMTQISTIEYYVITIGLITSLLWLIGFEGQRLYHEFFKT